MSAAMINVGLMRESRLPNSKRDGSCLRLRYGCCNGAPLGQNADRLEAGARRRLVGHLRPEVNFVATLTLEKS